VGQAYAAKTQFFRQFPRSLGQWGLLAPLASILLISLLRSSSRPAAAQGEDDPFTFVVTADMRNFAGPGYDSSDYFRGVVEAIDSLGKGAFMVSPGDVDPPANVLWTITRTLGITYTWYPVVGNHELPGDGYEDQPGDNMNWLNSYDYGTVNPGPTGCPTTTYSFDYRNAHFVMLNEYCDSSGDDVTDGDVPDHLHNWLTNDLSSTSKAHIFVFGHEPAYPQPDVDNGRARHMSASLNTHPTNRDRFWTLLKDEGVVAYFCGHTHNYSAVNVDGVWQVDVGHSRGAGDTGAPSTFVIIHVDGATVTFDTYRDEHDGNYDYDDITYSGTLAPCSALSFQDGVSPIASYAGTRDTTIDVDNPDTNYGDSSTTTLTVDGNPDRAAILQWDISSIPPGNTIQAASITLSVTNPSADTYELYEMKRDWVEIGATWNNYSSGNTWQQSGAQGTNDRGADVLGTISASSTGLYVINLNNDGITLVQRWVNDPSTNHGMIITDYSEDDSVLTDTQAFTWTTGGPRIITATAANAGGTTTGTHVITIHTPVQAAFTAAPTSGVEPLTVVFTNTSSGDYTTSLWGFGDGLTSTLQRPTHTYAAAAVYTITLTASGPGGSDTETKAEYITVCKEYDVYLPLVMREG